MHRLRYLALLLTAFGSVAMAPKRPVDPNQPTPNGLADPLQFQTRFKILGETYGARFIADAVSFSFRSFFGSTVGMCIMGGGQNRVQFSTSAWQNGSDVFREMLAFHELGHCLLGRNHKNTTHSDGRPESLMRSSMFSERIYTANREQYLKELFTAASAVSYRGVIHSRHSDEINDGPCRFGAE